MSFFPKNWIEENEMLDQILVIMTMSNIKYSFEQIDNSDYSCKMINFIIDEQSNRFCYRYNSYTLHNSPNYHKIDLYICYENSYHVYDNRTHSNKEVIEIFKENLLKCLNKH